jgi:hypothetical protein
MKYWNIEAMKRLMLHCLASSLHRPRYCMSSADISIQLFKTFQHIYEIKTTVFLDFAMEIEPEYFWNCQYQSSLPCFNIFIIKALWQLRQFREGMNWWNVNYGKNVKQWSAEEFNAGKKLKRWNFYCFIASLHCLPFHRFPCPALTFAHFCG